MEINNSLVNDLFINSKDEARKEIVNVSNTVGDNTFFNYGKK